MLNYKETQPLVEPVSLALAKNHLRVDFDDDDSLLGAYIVAARQWAETYTRRAFINRTVTLSLDAFPWWTGDGTIAMRERHAWPMFSAYWDSLAIRLPRPACVSVQSISYRDLTNTVQTLSPSTYYVDVTSEPARIVPAPGLTWPATQQYLPGSISVTYTAGTYGDGTDLTTIPQTIVAAILLLVRHLYDNQTVMDPTVIQPPPAIAMLLDTVKFSSFGYGH